MGMEFSPETLNDLCNLMCGGPEDDMVTFETFDSLQDRAQATREMLKNIVPQEDIESVVRHLNSLGFFSAPASTKYHGSYAGGLFDHSYSVAKSLIFLTYRLDLKWRRSESPVIIGLFHDLCKCDQYRLNFVENTYSYRTDTLFTDHGMKSALLAQRIPNIILNEEELACIVYHMGAFTDKEKWKDFTNAIHQYPNVLWTHVADMYSSHVLEVK